MGTGVYGAFTFAVVVIVSGWGVLHMPFFFFFLVNWFLGMDSGRFPCIDTRQRMKQ